MTFFINIPLSVKIVWALFLSAFFTVSEGQLRVAPPKHLKEMNPSPSIPLAPLIGKSQTLFPSQISFLNITHRKVPLENVAEVNSLESLKVISERMFFKR